jgi:hypothetical protein
VWTTDKRQLQEKTPDHGQKDSLCQVTVQRLIHVMSEVEHVSCREAGLLWDFHHVSK